MKTYRCKLLFIFIYFFIFSCSNKEEIDLIALSNNTPVEYIQTKSSLEYAQKDYSVTFKMVLEYLSSNKNEQKKIVSLYAYPDEDCPCLYVVNFEKGFEVFPSDSRFGLVLLKDDKEQLNLFESVDNPGFKLWIDDLVKQINKAREDRHISNSSVESVRLWDQFRTPSLTEEERVRIESRANSRSYSDVDLWAKIKYCNSSNTTVIANRGHLLPTKWGQSHPWNVSMGETNGEKWLTGCAAVAVSQVLYYFGEVFCNSPTGLYHTLSIANINTQYINNILCKTISLNRDDFTLDSPRWEEMPLDSLSTSITGYDYVSDLMLDVGERLGMYYSPYTSSVLTNNGFFEISPCKLNYTWDNYSSNSIPGVINALNQYTPVIVSAFPQSGVSGHTWVIDGYIFQRVVTFEKFIWVPNDAIPSGSTVYDTKTTSELVALYGSFTPGMIVEENHQATNYAYFKMNWGWDGNHDDNLYLINPSELWDNVYLNKYVHYNLVPQEFNIE